VRNLIVLASANPGIYGAPGAGHLNAGGALLFALFVVFVFGLIVATFLISEGSTTGGVIGFGLAGLALVIGFVCTPWMNSQTHSQNEARDKYKVSVTHWLQDDYGIEAAPKSVGHLLDGDSLVATLADGTQTTISIVEQTDGKNIAVVDDDKRPLTPISN